MSRKPTLACTAASSPEEQSLSPSIGYDESNPSTSKKQQVAKKGKGGTRKVSSLTDVQLEKKRANDREAQKNIRQRNKDRLTDLETQLAAEKGKVAERDACIRRLEHENADLRDQLQSRLARDTEGSTTSVDPRRPSVVRDKGSWHEPQQSSRRLSYAESMEMRPPTMAPPAAEMMHARSQTFPAPPPSFLNRKSQTFVPQQALNSQPVHAPTSLAGYGQSQLVKVEHGATYPPEILTQPDPLRFSTRATDLQHQSLAEDAPVQRVEDRAVPDPQGPAPGQQYQYTQILRSSSHDQHFQHAEHSPGHYIPYHASAAYPLPPPGPAQQYAHAAPQYGPIEPYPHVMTTSTAQQVSYPSGPGPPGRPPYDYYPTGYPQPPSSH